MDFPIKSFSLKGTTENEKIEVIIEKIYGNHINCSYDGNDFKGTVNIHIGSFVVNDALFYSSTGALYRLLVSLKQCYDSLEGTANFSHPYESNLIFDVKMTKNGHAVVEGEYQEFSHINTKLIFEMKTDQTCILATINELKCIVEHTGFGERGAEYGQY